MRRYLFLFVVIFTVATFPGCALKQKDLYVSEDLLPETSVISPTYKVEEASDEIIVEIKGAVKKPGVYKIQADSRLHDLFILAGEGTPTADLRTINLAMQIEDGESFYIPEEGEELVQETQNSTGTQTKDKKINLNKASKEELMTVTGIGPSTADNIIAFRENGGRFNSVDDLLQVNRIGEKTLDKIRDYFTVK